MIIKMDYQDIDIVGIRTTYNKRTKNHYIRFVVDEYSIEKAIKQTKGNKWVVALDYEGDLAYLHNIEEVPDIPIIVTKEISEVTGLTLDFYMMQLPEWVRVAIKTPTNFCDMRLVKEMSEKYLNIRFCGGRFLRLPGCNVGCIGKEDIPVKIAEGKISYYTEECACIKTSILLDDVEGVEILYKDVEAQKEVEKKRVISSLEDLLK